MDLIAQARADRTNQVRPGIAANTVPASSIVSRTTAKVENLCKDTPVARST